MQITCTLKFIHFWSKIFKILLFFRGCKVGALVVQLPEHASR